MAEVPLLLDAGVDGSTGHDAVRIGLGTETVLTLAYKEMFGEMAQLEKDDLLKIFLRLTSI